MLKWALTVVIALVVLAALTPWLARVGFGRLPGDLRFTHRGRAYSIPIASTIALSALLTFVTWLVR
jgi:hypothetical protein